MKIINRAEQPDNRGLSLVELIVAISIGVIVSGSIAALLVFAIRMYRNEIVNTSIQYELQTNLNTIMDEIMSSQTVVVVQNSGISIDQVNTKDDRKMPFTRCALFGKFTGVSDGSVKFSGVVFVSSSPDSNGKFKVYMNRVTDVGGADPKAVMKSCYGTVKSAFSKDPNPYLLGENVVQFAVLPDPDNSCLNDTELTYTNPMPVRVELSFSQNGWGDKVYNKHVGDKTYLRNEIENITAGSNIIPNVYTGILSDDDIDHVVYKEYKIARKSE